MQSKFGDTNIIDVATFDIAWSYWTRIRSREVPLLRPTDVDAAEAGWIRPGLLFAPLRAWRWLHRKLVGPTAVGYLRDQFAKCLPAEHRHLVAELDGSELLQQITVYTALQNEWMAEHGREAVRRARAALGPRAAAEALEASPVGQSVAHGANKLTVVPGGRLPGWMNGGAWTGRSAHLNSAGGAG